MLKGQVQALTRILTNEDLKSYGGDAFVNLIKAVVSQDYTALYDAAVDVKNLFFHMPTVVFWDKMRSYLYGTFHDFSEQVKLAEKFNYDNEKYAEFVKRQIHLINEIDDDKKVDYFAALTRCYLLTDLEEALFFKLVKYITMCTPSELEFIKNVSYEFISKNNAVISSLYQYGLFNQIESDGDIKYILSDFAKALKSDCLNFDEDTHGRMRLLTYAQLAPLNITEPITIQEF